MFILEKYTHSFHSSAPSVWNDLPSELKDIDISRALNRALKAKSHKKKTILG